MLATCICLNGSLLDQLSCTIVYLHNLFTCTFGRINMSVCLSVCLSTFLGPYLLLLPRRMAQHGLILSFQLVPKFGLLSSPCPNKCLPSVCIE